MDQKKAITSLRASMGLGQRKARPSPAAKRKEIQAAQAEVLESVLSEIRKRVRETPAWANAYNSAATVVELKLSAVRKGERPAAAEPMPASEAPEGWKQSYGVRRSIRYDRNIYAMLTDYRTADSVGANRLNALYDHIDAYFAAPAAPTGAKP